MPILGIASNLNNIAQSAEQADALEEELARVRKAAEKLTDY